MSSAAMLPDAPLDTHEVANQALPFTGFNAFDGDRALTEGVTREGVGWVADTARRLGALVTDPRVQDLAWQANRHVPEFRPVDRFGRRVDQVIYHPSWHELMGLAYGHGVHSLAWTADRPRPHVARMALSYLWNQVENGVGCPVGMSYAAVPALRLEPALAAIWEPPVAAAGYDPAPTPVADKGAATVGMTLTEKQGGSDLRANTTRAVPAGADDAWEITGHKWFFSAPMSDLFMTLAYTDKGPTCFVVPRLLPDGSRNRYYIQRLKEKCGNRSNASSEVEFNRTLGWRLGEEGRGIRAAIIMAHHTRIDFVGGSAGLMRLAASHAMHHAAHRRAFQKALIDQPLMGAVLADLAVECEAALAISLRIARAVDDQDGGGTGEGDEAARLFERLATPVAKYWVCKRAVGVVHEALECHGGNGFIEEGPLARLYREAPLNGIWEGTGNVVCLDILRALAREPGCADAFFDELDLARGADRRFDAWVSALKRDLPDLRVSERRARELAERLAVALQGALLLRQSPPAVADAFCATRLVQGGAGHYGGLPDAADIPAILARARVDA